MDIRRRMMLSTMGGFPSQEPTAYELIETYTSSGEFTAPENGYFQIEVFGASGNGGTGVYENKSGRIVAGGGGGGGGGGYACSRVKLKKGDKLIISPGAVGVNSSVDINSSIEIYSQMNVSSGQTGGSGYTDINNKKGYGGAGGAGGVASGGNYLNFNGNTGGNGEGKYTLADDMIARGGAQGTPGYSGGRYGGSGATINQTYPPDSNKYTKNGYYGVFGFIKIYRGNTN